MKIEKLYHRVAFWITAILLALLPFHAFFWTWLHSFFWTENWTIFVQAWKEILVGALALLALGRVVITRKLPREKTWWFALALVVLALVYFFGGENMLAQKILGLRTATLFLVAFLAVTLFEFTPREKNTLEKIVLGGGAFVILFALAQKFLLPLDFLKHFGYSTNISAWLPGGNLPIYHLVEGRENLIRLQSTFAGPNQLAGYLLVVLPLMAFRLIRTLQQNQKLATQFLKKSKFLNFKNWKLSHVGGTSFRNWILSGAWCLVLGIFLGGFLTLYFTYSRSAWLGLSVILLVACVRFWSQQTSTKLRRVISGVMIFGIVWVTTFFFTQPNFQAIFLRENSTGAHFTRMIEAEKETLAHPLGLGLGTTAGVSQRFDTERNLGLTPENTYLGITLETGWLGGILFLAFIGTLLTTLARRRKVIFYALLGVAVIALFLHPLEDAPTALTLFLLTGINFK